MARAVVVLDHLRSDGRTLSRRAGAADELKGVEEDWLADGDGESEDGVDLKDLAEQFRAAEEAVGTRLGGVLPESAQRRLYALHMVARHGTAAATLAACGAAAAAAALKLPPFDRNG